MEASRRWPASRVHCLLILMSDPAALDRACSARKRSAQKALRAGASRQHENPRICPYLPPPLHAKLIRADFCALLVVLALLLVELALLLRRGILVLLVLRDQVVHVRLRLRELHLVHAFACVPMQECLAPEHCREVF